MMIIIIIIIIITIIIINVYLWLNLNLIKKNIQLKSVTQYFVIRHYLNAIVTSNEKVLVPFWYRKRRPVPVQYQNQRNERLYRKYIINGFKYI